MALMVLTTQYLSISGTDWSSRISKAELTVDVDEKDVTTMASAGWKEVIGGLKSGQLSVEFKQDFAASNLDATVWPLLGTVVTFATRPTSSAVSTSNPSYSGSVLIKSWNPISGGVGDDATVSVTWPTSGAVTRATA